MAYATVSEIRTLSGLSSNTISDADLTSILSFATSQLNRDILTHISEEYVQYIDVEKQNYIDGSNTTFYVQYPYLGDGDDDGDVDGSDLYVWTIDTTGTRVEYTVSSVELRTGKFVLSSAPAMDTRLYVNYYSSPVNLNDPHPLVKLAVIQLSSALAYMRQNTGGIKSWRVGKIAATRDSAYDVYFKKYQDTVNKILENWLVEGKSERYV